MWVLIWDVCFFYLIEEYCVIRLEKFCIVFQFSIFYFVLSRRIAFDVNLERIVLYIGDNALFTVV